MDRNKGRSCCLSFQKQRQKVTASVSENRVSLLPLLRENHGDFFFIFGYVLPNQNSQRAERHALPYPNTPLLLICVCLYLVSYFWILVPYCVLLVGFFYFISQFQAQITWSPKKKKKERKTEILKPSFLNPFVGSTPELAGPTPHPRSSKGKKKWLYEWRLLDWVLDGGNACLPWGSCIQLWGVWSVLSTCIFIFVNFHFVHTSSACSIFIQVTNILYFLPKLVI